MLNQSKSYEREWLFIRDPFIRFQIRYPICGAE